MRANLRYEEVVEFADRLLRAYGVPADHAVIAAECIVQADLRGVSTHGLIRLDGYLERIRRGVINPTPNISVTETSAGSASVDGDNGLGFVVATRATGIAVDLAASQGIGMVGVRRSTHFGMAALYVNQAIQSGFGCIVLTNASRALPPWGGRTPLFGTSPLAVGLPGGKLGHFVLDMSPAVAARGKIRAALRRGEKIPLGYALDANGEDTTDPAAALEGTVLPIGGHKGAGLAMMMDIFGGVMTGAAFAGGVGDQYRDLDRPQDVGHVFIAINPSLFIPADDYSARMDALFTAVHDVDRAKGFSEVVVPGELEARAARHHARDGIPYEIEDLEPLFAKAGDFDIPRPHTIENHPI